MKKIFLSLTIVSSMLFVSCEKEEIEETTGTTETTGTVETTGTEETTGATETAGTEETTGTTETTTQEGGYWEYVCDVETLDVPYTYCDSVWNEGVPHEHCDSVIAYYDSYENPVYEEKECYTVYYGGKWEVKCWTAYEVEEVRVCDSVWVSF